MTGDDKFFPDIFEHLDNSHTAKAVSAKGLEDMIAQVSAKTGLQQTIAKEIVIAFFQEVRSAMLRGDVVTIRNLGKFILARPDNSDNKKKIFAKFKPYKHLLARMNNER